MGYICTHGLLYGSCYDCSVMTEAIEELGYVLVEEEVTPEMYEDYYWLDRDEAKLRREEMEDNG